MEIKMKLKYIGSVQNETSAYSLIEFMNISWWFCPSKNVNPDTTNVGGAAVSCILAQNQPALLEYLLGKYSGYVPVENKIPVIEGRRDHYQVELSGCCSISCGHEAYYPNRVIDIRINGYLCERLKSSLYENHAHSRPH